MRPLIVLLLLAGAAGATPPEPKGPHPRMLLDAELRAAWKAQAKLEHGPVVGAIRLCADARNGHEYDHAVYMGAVWQKVVQACLVSWVATDNKDDAATAIRFTQALIDDLEVIGDKAGGDNAARRDSGYAIRMLGPMTALAYDWLYDQMPPALRERARSRWKAWLDWYRDNGYRAHNPGSNYHAGYLLSATMIAIAEGGETDGSLWREVADTMWGKEMAVAFSEDGMLHGGDWPEGWQYGPLSVAEYALAARVARGAGIEVKGASAWLSALLRRHVYGLSPADGVYAGGDTEDEKANLEVGVLTLNAIVLGDSTPDDKRYARGELSRLKLADQEWLLYDALAAVGDKPVLVPRSTWPTWYFADGTGTLFARTRWDNRAIWFVTDCHARIDVDHRHQDAGNFVLSRGLDDVIVDPSPYGTESTLTSNAPTVASAQLPKDYIPSQAGWSEKTSYDWVTQRKSGVVVTRCDYSDQYKFQDRRSDVPDAMRDLVMIPSEDGTNAAVVVIDRADTTDTDRHMYLRFRTPGHLALSGTRATATVGSTALTIAPIGSVAGKPVIGAPTQKDCFKEGTVRGTCDAARFPVTDYRVELPGPKPVAMHLLTATDPSVTVTSTPLDGGVHLSGMRDATVMWRAGSYTTPPGIQVVLAAPATASITAKHTDGGCSVDIKEGGAFKGSPLVFALDKDCNVSEDPEGPAASAAHTRIEGGHHSGGSSRSPRSGCCGAQAAPNSPLAMGVVVLAVVLRRRRR